MRVQTGVSPFALLALKPLLARVLSKRLCVSVSLLILFFAVMFAVPAGAQTTLVSATGDGGFETGGSVALNNWTALNASTDGWVVGTAAGTSNGSNAAYISSTGGATWAYSQVSTISHLYRDFTVPAGESIVTVNFKWKAGGEGSGISDWDNLKVFIAPNTYSPLANLAVLNTYLVIGSGGNPNGWYNLNASSYNNGSVSYSAVPGTTYRLIFSWKSDVTDIANPPAALDEVSIVTSAPTGFTASATGGLWNSPATWVGGVVPGSGNDITIPSGSIVTVNQALNYRDINIDGTLQWGSTSFAMTASGNVNISSTGKFHPYTTGGTGQTLNIGGNFTNNGYANLSLGSTLLNFNGSGGGTLSGTGTFEGNGSSGIVRALFYQSIGSSVINTSQNLVTTSFAHGAGSLNTNGKLSIDNTVQSFGQPLNNQVANVVVTAMGSGYTTAPNVSCAGAANFVPSGAVSVGNVRISGSNIYLVTVAGTASAVPPTHTSGAVVNGTATFLWLGTVGTIGTPYITTALTLGTQYFYGDNLYTAVATTAQPTPPTHTSGTVGSFQYVGQAAKLSVNWDAATQTVRSLSIVNPGSGYRVSAPAISIVNTSAGSGVTASAVLIQAVPGSANSLTQKSGIATISGGINIRSDQGVGGITTTNGGVYATAPSVGFSLPTGFLNLVTNGGSGYTSTPTVTLSGGTNLTGFTNPTFSVVVAQGKVVSVICTGGGTLWTSPPTLTLTGGGGTGATAEFPANCLPVASPVLTNGTITDFTISNAGFGYAAAPSVGLVGTSIVTATAPTARIGLYNLTQGFFAPAPSNALHTETGVVPANRRINQYTLNSASNAQFTGDIELYNSAPITWTLGSIDMGSNTLAFTHPSYAGTSATATNFVSSGKVRLSTVGGSVSRTFPLAATFSVGTGTGSGATGSEVTSLTAEITGAPSGSSAIGTRAYRLNSNGALFGTNPTVTMNWNATDALTGNLENLFISQSTALTGPWTPRSTATGSGTITATGSRTTATSGLGPIVPTGDDYFAWTQVTIDSANVTVPQLTCVASAKLISGDFTTTAGTITSVTISYNNGAAAGPFPMTNTVGNTWEYTIPVASPSNSVVTWSITVTNSFGITRTFTGTPYQDEPLTGAVLSINGVPNPVCAGSETVLTASATGLGLTTLTGFTWNDGTSDVGFTNPYNATISANTTFTVTATNDQGCSIVSAPYTVNVNALPSPPTTAPSSQCGTGIPACFAVGTNDGNYRWYLVPTGGTAIPGEVNGTLSSYIISSTTTFYVAIFDGVCESNRTSVVATVIPPDAVQALVDNNNPCSNAAISLSAQQTGSNQNYTYTWTASPEAGSGISNSTPPSGSPVSVTPTAPGTYVYTVNAVDGSCATSSTVSVTVKPLPVIVSSSASPTTVCAGEPVNLTATTNTIIAGNVTIGTGTLTNSAASTTSTGYPAPFGNYYFGALNQFLITAAELSAAGLQPGNITSIAFDVATVSTAPLSNFSIGIKSTGLTALSTLETGFTSVFSQATYTPSASTGYAANTINFSTPFNWDGTSNIIIQTCFANSGFTTNAVFRQSTTSYVSSLVYRADLTTVCSSPGAVTFSYSQRPNLRFGGQVNSTGAGSYNWVWNPGNLSGASVTVNPTSTTNYTVTATDPGTGCSIDQNVSVTVNPIPDAPTGTGSEQCGTAVPTASVSSNSGEPTPQFNWYTVPTGGSPVQTGTSSTYTSTVSVSTTFYVSETSAAGCEGERTAVTVIVQDPDVLTATSSTGSSACLGESFDLSSSYTPDFNSFATYDLTATGGSVSGVTGTVSLTPNVSGSDPYSVTPTAVGTYTYTITAFDPDKGCISIGTVTVTVNPLPVIDSVRSDISTVCAGSPVNLSVYSAGGLATGPQTLPTGYCTAGLYSSGCGAFGDYIGNVSFAGVINRTSTCDLAGGYAGVFSTQVPDLALGGTYPISVGTNPNDTEGVTVWIDLNRNGDFEASEALFTPAFAGTVNVTYSGNLTIPGTASLGRTIMRVRANYNQAPGTAAACGTAATWGETEDYVVNIVGVVTQNPALTYTWNPGSLSGANVTVNPTSTTTYSVIATDANGCSSIGTNDITITVNPLPNAPIGVSSTQCGQGVPTASVSTGGANGTFFWYDAPTGGTLLQTGGSTYASSISSTTTFYVSESDGTCESERTAVTATVTPPPALVITPSGSTTFCDGGSVTLDAGTNSDPSYVNFSWSPATGLNVSNAAVVIANPSTTTTYTLTANDGLSNGCTNTATVTVTVNPNPVISSVTATPANICVGGSSVLQATSIAGGPGTATVGAGLTTEFGTSPYRTGANAARLQYLYTATELNAAGIQAGNITSIAFNVTSLGSPTTIGVYQIFIGQTAATSLTTSFINTGLTSVFGPQAITVSSGLNTHTFSTPFNWDGTSNIVVQICQETTSPFTTATVTADAFTDRSLGVVSFVSGSQCATATGTLSSARPRPTFGATVGNDVSSSFNWTWNPVSLPGSLLTVTPTTTTNYTVTAVNPVTLCSTTSAPVTVNVLPVTANAVASPATPVCAGSAVSLSANGTGGEPLSYSWSDGTNVIATLANITVNPTVTTTYTVTVTDACGNPTTSSVTVNVNPLPTVTVSPTTGNFCNPGGTPVTLTASGADTYTWAPAAGLSATTGASVDATPTVTTTYVVSGTDANGCVNTASAVISVSQNLTNLAAVASPNPICVGSTLNLAANHDPLVGYSLNSNSGVAFIDISGTGTSVGTISDDSEHNVTLPSPFTYNGTAYTTIRIGNNGALVFGATTGDITFTNTALPTSSLLSGAAIAAMWDDLFPGSGGSITTQLVGSKFIIQWTNEDNFGATGTGTVTFQVQLDQSNGQIHLVYQDVSYGVAGFDGGETATVGLNYSASSALQYSFNTASLVDGQSLTFTPVSATYSWSGPNGFVSTDRNPVISDVTAVNAGVYTVNILTSAGCPATASTAAVVVNDRPTGALSGTDIAYCEGSVLPTTLSIAVTGTGPWSGTLSDGSTFSGSVSPIVVNVTPTVTTTYSIATLTDANCASVAGDLSGSVTVTVNPLATTPVVSVTQPTCSVATGTLTITSPVGSGIQYSLDGGPFQSSPVFSGVAPGPHSVDVQSDAGCGSTGAASVTVNPQPFIPAPPTVTGIVNVCPFIGTSEQITYTATAAGATSYTWTLPPNVTLISGAGTSTITVTFQTGFATQANKQLRVRASSICGTSAQTIYYLAAQLPNTPAPITGPTSACAYLDGTPVVYSVPAAAGAASYIWTAQPGVNITPAGPGAAGNSVTVVFPPTFTTSAITVQAVNDCGVSGVRSITVTRANPSTPSPITGPTNVCEHIAPNGTAATYTVPLQPGVTTYTWTLPAGALNVTGQGTNTISFIYPAGYTGGSISVSASNGCGSSPSARSLTVSTLSPATPSVIDVINTVSCPNREFTYSIASLPANATSVQWTIPAGATLLSGQGTTSITVSYPTTAIAGTVSAVAVNNCGTSVARNVEVKLPACPDPEFAKGVKVTPAPTKQVDQMEVSVFPNPSVSDFKLQVRSKSNELIHVRVLDMTGREYKLHQMMPNETLSLGATLKAGAYILEIRQGKELKTTKVLKF